MKKPGHKKTFFRQLFRVVSYLMLALIVLSFLAIGYFYYNKDVITKKILLSLNQNVQGKISFSDISLNITKHFPSISLEMDSVDLFENKNSEKPIIKIVKLFVAVNISDLLAGKVMVNKLSLEGSEFKIIKLTDGSYNLQNALKRTNTETDNFTEKNSATKLWNNKQFSLNIKQLHLKNSKISYHENTESFNTTILLQNLKASVLYKDEDINIDLLASIKLIEYSTEQKLIKNKQLKISLGMVYQIAEQTISIQKGTLSWNKAIFDVLGTIDMKDKGWVDLTFDGSAHNIDFLKIYLKETAIKNIEKGKLIVKGTAIGAIQDGIPNIEIQFGLKDMKIGIPNAVGYIDDANLRGSFSSGNKRDLSMSELKIDTVSAKLPGGKVAGSLKISNLKLPEIKLSIDLDADIKGLEKVFNISMIDSLAGKIALKSKIEGSFKADSLNTYIGKAESDISFDSVSFSIPRVMYVKLFDGNLSLNSDTLNIDKLHFQTDDTDITINGWINNMLNLFFNKEKAITAHLQVESPLFDLPQFFAYNPSVGEGFPYKIKDINLDLRAITSTLQLLNPEPIPKIEFDIQHLDATVIDFMAPVSISHGIFNLGTKDEGLFLDFSDFHLQTEGADLATHVQYFSDYQDSSYVQIDLLVRNLIPGRILFYQSNEKAPEMYNGILNTSSTLLLNLSGNAANFKNIDLECSNLNYFLSNDTLETQALKLSGKNIKYNFNDNKNVLSSLTALGKLQAAYIKNSDFTIKNIELGIAVEKGDFNIDLKKINFFDEDGNGKIEMSPFAKIPSYHLDYAVNQFDILPLTQHFTKDTILSGKADFNVNVSMQGNDWSNAISQMEGKINCTGQNIILYGYNADNLINKLKKTQNFDLIDVGAVLVAGPFGIAIAKGSEYTSLLINKSSAITHVQQFISDYTIRKGILTMSDVAFTTQKNRVAAKGFVDLNSDSLQVTVAVLNKRGCSTMSQKLHGKIQNPKISTLKVAQSFVQPIINLVDLRSKLMCVPFYKGSLAQPEEKKSKKN